MTDAPSSRRRVVELVAALAAYGVPAPALAYETHGDPDASPDLHGGLWVPWLEDEYRGVAAP